MKGAFESDSLFVQLNFSVVLREDEASSRLSDDFLLLGLREENFRLFCLRLFLFLRRFGSGVEGRVGEGYFSKFFSYSRSFCASSARFLANAWSSLVATNGGL